MNSFNFSFHFERFYKYISVLIILRQRCFEWIIFPRSQ